METIQKQMDVRNKSLVQRVINNPTFITQQHEILRRYYTAFLSGELKSGKHSRRSINSYATIQTIFNAIKNHTIWLNNCCEGKTIWM